MRTYSREDAAKTQGRTRPPARGRHRHRDHTPHPHPGRHPETMAGYRSRGSCTTLDSPSRQRLQAGQCPFQRAGYYRKTTRPNAQRPRLLVGLLRHPEHDHIGVAPAGARIGGVGPGGAEELRPAARLVDRIACGPWTTVTCGMPLTRSCTSPMRARRDRGGMLASVRVGDAPGPGTWHNRRGSVFGLPGLAGPPGAAVGAAHGPVRPPAEAAWPGAS